MTKQLIEKLRDENNSKVARNMKLISATENEYDIFDRLVIIEGWFEKLNPRQQLNLIDNLTEKIGQ